MDATSQAYAPATQKAPSGWGKLWAAFGLGVAAFVVMVVSAVAALLLQRAWTLDDNVTYTINECIAGLVALLFVIALGGRSIARPSLKGMGEAWKAALWLFIVNGGLLAVGIVEMVIGVEPFELAEDWPVRVAVVAALCLGVGMFEESTMRGLCLNGLLARMGRTRAGVYGAVILSSLMFGMMHFDFTVGFSDPLQIAQNVMKVVQTGMCGFLFAAILVKTRNLWTVILIHAANDFMLLVISNGLMHEAVSTEYVASGDEGLAILTVYCVISALYLPFIPIGKRLIDQASPWRGAFYRPAAEAALPAALANVPHAGIPVAAPVSQPSMPQPAPASSTSWPTDTHLQAPIAPDQIDEATAKAMRGKHAAPLGSGFAKGTTDDQSL